jgi:hypothetical protein
MKDVQSARPNAISLRVARSAEVIQQSQLTTGEYSGAPGVLARPPHFKGRSYPNLLAYGVTVNLLVLVAVPAAVVTATGPVTAPEGTSASTLVSLITW